MYKVKRENVFFPYSIKLPRGTKKKLDIMSREKETSITVLINLALANELSREKPFTLDLNIDHIPYVHEDTEDTKKLFEFIRKFPDLGLEYLACLGQEIGIDTVERILIAHRHLVEIGIIIAVVAKTRNRSYVYRIREFRRSGPLPENPIPIDGD